MVKLRKWDDGAKIVGIEWETPRAETYRGMIQKHLEAWDQKNEFRHAR